MYTIAEMTYALKMLGKDPSIFRTMDYNIRNYWAN